jgi:hypothetical protein
VEKLKYKYKGIIQLKKKKTGEGVGIIQMKGGLRFSFFFFLKHFSLMWRLLATTATTQ